MIFGKLKLFLKFHKILIKFEYSIQIDTLNTTLLSAEFFFGGGGFKIIGGGGIPPPPLSRLDETLFVLLSRSPGHHFETLDRCHHY